MRSTLSTQERRARCRKAGHGDGSPTHPDRAPAIRGSGAGREAAADLPRWTPARLGRGLPLLLGRRLAAAVSIRTGPAAERLLRVRPREPADRPGVRVQRAGLRNHARLAHGRDRPHHSRAAQPEGRRYPAVLREEIASDPAVTQPAPNSLYFLFLPPGVTVELDGGSSCMNFCGYHSAIDEKVFYAVMPFPECEGCTGGLVALDTLTSTRPPALCQEIT